MGKDIGIAVLYMGLCGIPWDIPVLSFGTLGWEKLYTVQDALGYSRKSPEGTEG